MIEDTTLSNTEYIGFDDQLPRDVAERLYNELQNNIGLRTANLRRLRKAVHEGTKPDYDADWAAFTYLYFGANYLKCYNAILHALFKQDSPLRFLDLGCGAGASTVGAISALRHAFKSGEIKVTAVDKNSSQLRCYRKVSVPWLQAQKGITCKLVHARAAEFLETQLGNWDLILCSYVLEEQNASATKRLRKLLKRSACLGSSIVIVGTSDTTGHCEIEYVKPDLSVVRLPMHLKRQKVDLGKLTKLNHEELPMYA